MKNNKGFSLVELIIVIAIMAILVGVLAPTYLRYVQKAAISADLELVGSISKAVTYASADQDILDDPVSYALVNSMTSATKLEDLATSPSNALADEIMDTLGWDSLAYADYSKLIRSRHDTNATIYIQHQGSVVTPYVVWISYTDVTGSSNYADAQDITDINNCICAK